MDIAIVGGKLLRLTFVIVKKMNRKRSPLLRAESKLQFFNIIVDEWTGAHNLPSTPGASSTHSVCLGHSTMFI